MKNTNKKGFTIVELVIVIAVIAILAAVLIPTFSSVIHNANASSALQEVKQAYVEAYSDALAKNSGNLSNLKVATDSNTKVTTFTCYTTVKGDYRFTFSAKGLMKIEYVKETAVAGTYEYNTDGKYAKNYKATFTSGGDITVVYEANADFFKDDFSATTPTWGSKVNWPTDIKQADYEEPPVLA